MNNLKKLAVATLLVASPVLAFAHGSEGASQGHGPGMMMDQDQMERMHQNWSRMDDMMEQVPATSSAKERQRLLEQHRETMEEQMELMHRNMMGPVMGGSSGMMGQGMMGGQSGNDARPGNAQGMNSEERFRFMEERMDQMQLMMEQMLRHQRQLDQE